MPRNITIIIVKKKAVNNYHDERMRINYESVMIYYNVFLYPKILSVYVFDALSYYM